MKSINFLNTLIVILGFGFGLGILSYSCKAPTVALNATEVAGEADLRSLYDALENGGSIVLKKMIYNLDTPLKVIGKNNLTLDGAGSTFVMKDKNADVVFIEGSTNVILKNFKATHVEPEGPIGCTGSVIQVYGGANISIQNCALNGSGIIGVVSYNTKNLKITENYIYNNSQYGILYQGDTNLEIMNNTFENNGSKGNDHVAKALDPMLSQIQKKAPGTSEEGLKMAKNTFK